MELSFPGAKVRGNESSCYQMLVRFEALMKYISIFRPIDLKTISIFRHFITLLHSMSD